VRYNDERPPEPAEYAQALAQRLGDAPYEIFLEPGRAIAANAGVLLTRVEYIKAGEAKDFAVIDAAMNDLIRPSLYQAWQSIVTVLEQNTLLAVRSSGAYGFTMASNYNTRPRVPEIMVDGDTTHLVRRRETVQELFAGEALLP